MEKSCDNCFWGEYGGDVCGEPTGRDCYRDTREIWLSRKARKTCRMCGCRLALSRFGLRKDSPDGHRAECKECQRKAGKAYRARTAKRTDMVQCVHSKACPGSDQCCHAALHLPERINSGPCLCSEHNFCGDNGPEWKCLPLSEYEARKRRAEEPRTVSHSPQAEAAVTAGAEAAGLTVGCRKTLPNYGMADSLMAIFGLRRVCPICHGRGDVEIPPTRGVDVGCPRLGDDGRRVYRAAMRHQGTEVLGFPVHGFRIDPV